MTALTETEPVSMWTAGTCNRCGATTSARTQTACRDCGLLRRPVTLPGDWALDGLCTQVDPDLFYPPMGGDPEPAKRVCAVCPVRLECLRHALNTNEMGVWGGTTESQRRRMKEGRP